MTAYERHPPHPVGGTIEVITGPMFSGKTEELLRRMRRAAIAKQAICLIKPLRDDRHGTTDVVSHDARRQTAIAVERAEDIERHIDNLDRRPEVVVVDEVQFFDLEVVDVCNRLADAGIRVIVAGLDLDYLGRPFGPMPLLLAHASSANTTATRHDR
jgi:thymidine kinase